MMVIANPQAGRVTRARLARACGRLRDLGYSVRILWTEQPGDGRRLALMAAESGAAVVVAAGGDGTVAEVAAGLLDYRPIPLNQGQSDWGQLDWGQSDRGPALGLLPLGTANVLAQAICLGAGTERAVKALHGGRRRALPLGLVNDRPFLSMTSVGLDSQVVRTLDLGLKARIGQLAYVVGLIREMGRYRYPTMTASVERPDGGQETVCGVLALVTRSPFYGGRMRVVREANPFAPSLHLVMLQRAGLWASLSYGFALLAGRLWHQRGVAVVPVTRVVLDSDHPLPVQADGDLVGTLPVTVTLATRSLDLIVPEETS